MAEQNEKTTAEEQAWLEGWEAAWDVAWHDGWDTGWFARSAAAERAANELEMAGKARRKPARAGK